MVGMVYPWVYHITCFLVDWWYSKKTYWGLTTLSFSLLFLFMSWLFKCSLQFFFNDALCLCKSCMYISIVTCLSQYMLLLGSLCRRIHQQTLPILTYYCEYVFIRRSMHDIFKYPHFGYFVGEVLVHITYEGRMGIYVCIMHSTITHIVIDSERAYSRFTVQAHIFKLGMCYPNLYIYIYSPTCTCLKHVPHRYRINIIQLSFVGTGG